MIRQFRTHIVQQFQRKRQDNTSSGIQRLANGAEIYVYVENLAVVHICKNNHASMFFEAVNVNFICSSVRIVDTLSELCTFPGKDDTSKLHPLIVQISRRRR